MSATLLGTTKPLVEEFELALLDLDGVCYSGADPVVHATDSVMAAKGQGYAPGLSPTTPHAPPPRW